MTENKQVRELFNATSFSYGEDAKSTGSMWLMRRKHVTARKALAEIGPTSVLEIGCGNGLFILYALKTLPETKFTGIDISEEMLKVCLGRIKKENIPNVSLAQSCAGALPFADNSFEMVMLVNTFQHFSYEEIPVVLSEAHRVLVPGGYLYFDFKNSLHPLVTYRIKVKKIPVPILAYSLKEINLFLKKKNFTPIRTYKIGSLLSLGIKKFAPSIGILAEKK